MFPSQHPGARMDMMTGAGMAAAQGGSPMQNMDLSKFAGIYGKEMPGKAKDKAVSPGAQEQDKKKMLQTLAKMMGKPMAMAKTLTQADIDAHVEELERMRQTLFGGSEEPEGNPEMGGGAPEQPFNQFG